MPIYETSDGAYLIVIDDPADGNSVVYDKRTMTPLWDRLSHEAMHGGPVRPAPPSAPPPPPYHPPPATGLGASRILHVTDGRDGQIINRGYAYWSQVWVDQDGTALVFAGSGGGTPHFYRVELVTGEVERLGARVPYVGEGEGWYFDPRGWVYLAEGPRLHHVHPITGTDEVVLDISGSNPGCRLWQCHSSDDGECHSATVQQITGEGAYPKLGTLVQRHGVRDWYAAEGDLDESHLSPDGLFLVIEESNNNRVIDFETGLQHFITNADGALAHIDMGDGYMIGEDDQAGRCAWINLRNLSDRRTIFSTWGMGHVSVRNDRCLVSNPDGLFLARLDGSGLRSLAPHGMIVPPGIPDWLKYDYQVHANLDHSGRVGAFVTNHGSGRMDLDLVIL